MVTIRDDYSGRSQYELILDFNVHSYSGNSVRFSYNLRARSKSGYGSYTDVAGEFRVSLGNNLIVKGNKALAFGPGGNDFTGKEILLASGVTNWFGLGTWDFAGSHSNVGVFGSAIKSGSIPTATVPPAPDPLPGTPDQITANSMRYQFYNGGTGGSPIIRWEYQWSTSPTFASGNSAIFTSTGTSIVQGLPSGTPIYLRSRGVNAVGNGVWSATRSGTTLTTSAPGIAVTPAIDGTSAKVTLTPPPSMPSSTQYRLEYRVVNGATSTISPVASSVTVSPLAPGATYEWRAAALSGTTPGPYTAWIQVIQPNPNVNTGDFFDGNTPDKVDIAYEWSGAVNNSISWAIGKAVRGWGTFASGSTASGGAGVVYRVTAGRSQPFTARVDFWGATTAAGFHAGISWDAVGGIPVLPGASYDGLLHVRLPVRSNRLAAMLIWVNASNVEVGRDVGPSQVVAASGSGWTPLRVSGAPPATAVRGALRVIDVAGSGWSLWAPGDVILLDDFIAPFNTYYFDGNTPDTATTDYRWDGTPNASPSRAAVSTTPAPDPLLDPDCPPIPAPPRPPSIDDSCVETETDRWRRYYQEIPKEYVHTWIDSVPVLQIETNTPARLVRVRYWPNPFDRPLSELEENSYCSEQIISFIPGDTIFTLDGMSQRAYAEVATSSNSLAADHLLHSDSNVWPELTCGLSYYVTVDVPSDTPQNALELRYSLAHRY